MALTATSYGRINHDFENRRGTSISSYLNLGIDWFKLPYDAVFNSYFEYRVNYRTKNNLFYNAHGPVVGVEIRRNNLRIGWDHYWENLPELNTSEIKSTIYIRWYYDWNFKSNK